MIQDAIFARLQAVAGLTALVGTRCYYRLLQENTLYPAIKYFQVSGPRDPAMGVNSGIVRSRWQFDVYDIDQDAVVAVVEQLRLALDRYRGTFLVSAATKQWFDTFYDNVQDPEPELVDAVPVYRSICDYMIDYQD